MTTKKLYAGAKLRETRNQLGLTQKAFAEKLGVSLPYLNQMENNNRPISTTVVLALASELGLDVTELSAGDSERLVSDMRERLAERTLGNQAQGVIEDSNLVREFLLEYGIRFANYQDQEQLLASQMLGIRAFPETFIVDPEGLILKRLSGERAWNESTFRSMLSNQPAAETGLTSGRIKG